MKRRKWTAQRKLQIVLQGLKGIRSRLGIHARDRFKAEVGPDQITLTRLRTESRRINPYKGRKVWDAPGAIATEADFELALGRARKDRDQRASGL